MCGIVGYIGAQKVVPILLEGLEKLEYRGYDSAGIAVIDKGQIEVRKCVGKLNMLRSTLYGAAPEGHIGIGHTRWATHGRPSDANSHPHTDCKGNFVVVHNGIIENHHKLREELQAKGHIFKSETDTEVLPHLVEEFFQGDLEAAVLQTINKVEGSYAMVVLSRQEPEKLVAARKDNPLIIGVGEGENFFASDIPAILNYTRRIIILEDGEIAVIKRDEIKVTDAEGNCVNKEVQVIKWDAVAAEKAGYDHYMLKEINEQPRALRDTLSARFNEEGSQVILEEIELTSEEIANIRQVYIVACGTAYHAGMVGKYVIEELARIPVQVDIASEFRYRNPIVDEHTLVIVVSQSGETADTLAGLREAKRRGAKVIGVTNVLSSSVAREAHHTIYTWAGPEIAVASTKAYTTQLICMYLIAIFLGQGKGLVNDEQAKELIAAMKELPAKAQEILDQASKVKEFVDEYAKCEDVFFLGRGVDYAVALEGSLKLKEISYIHAEAYAAGELKHGTLALIVKGILVLALATQDNLFDKMVSNIAEVKARDASVLGVAFRGNTELAKSVDHMLYIPETHRLLSSVLTVIPLQLLAYYVAVARGCDVDKPRNLAKSVTVE
ncbi:MAG: glutamine--fructose-6-phosphate transaminase (isomerizing) [Carboxydocellales bacterium]